MQADTSSCRLNIAPPSLAPSAHELCAADQESRRFCPAQITSNLPARPDYFLEDAAINRAGATPLTELPELKPISAAELSLMLERGAIALDVRPNDQFAAGHVPGSINVALSGQFASWAGAVLGLSANPVLIAETAEQLDEARIRLARVGIEDLAGYLDGGAAAWQPAGFALQQLPQITVQELNSRLRANALHVLDVRRETEWRRGTSTALIGSVGLLQSLTATDRAGAASHRPLQER